MFSSESTTTNAIRPQQQFLSADPWLRWISKSTCGATLFLIFAGAMVKSTGSGLAVPDWPLSYGMLFPPMIGGVFYEHGHRMVAATVGLFMLCLALSLRVREPRRWVKILGYYSLGTVVLQGILGGGTVLFFLPTPISVFHGVLAQIFFILTIIIAYSQSKERQRREYTRTQSSPQFLRWIMLWIGFIFFQLMLGAVMRHTEAGLAIPDFPKMGGSWIPTFNSAMLDSINDWRFEQGMEPVHRAQVVYHFAHRFTALWMVVIAVILNIVGFRHQKKNQNISGTLLLLDVCVAMQIALGAWTVLTQKSPLITSLHVVNGAAILGISVLLLLRSSPLSYSDLQQSLVH
jgi:cytochrome c oxidase assembly protein subunit 15